MLVTNCKVYMTIKYLIWFDKKQKLSCVLWSCFIWFFFNLPVWFLTKKSLNTDNNCLHEKLLPGSSITDES